MKITRRKFIGNIAIGGAVIATFSIIGCKPGEKKTGGKAEPKSDALKCDDVSGLTEADKKTRTALGYKEATADGKTCDTCTLYVPATGCGGCKIMKGTVNPKGSCVSFAKKA